MICVNQEDRLLKEVALQRQSETIIRGNNSEVCRKQQKSEKTGDKV